MECSLRADVPILKAEQVVIGTLLNNTFRADLFTKNRLALRPSLFRDKRNRFIFSLMERMHDEGLTDTTPCDVLLYSLDKEIKFGSVTNFATYMAFLSDAYYAHKSLKQYIRLLVQANRNAALT